MNQDPSTMNDVGMNSSAAETIGISVNGKSMELPVGATIKNLLERLEINTRAVAVEVNQELQPKAVHDQYVIAGGDQLEIVTLVGGG